MKFEINCKFKTLRVVIGEQESHMQIHSWKCYTDGNLIPTTINNFKIPLAVRQ